MERLGVDIVNGLLVRTGTVLLVKRSAYRKAYPNTWSFPGGHTEPDETGETALARELVEEIGVLPVDPSAVGVISDPNAEACKPITYHMYIVTTWFGGDPIKLGDEHSELRWFTPEEAMRLSDLALPDAYRALLETLIIDQV